MKKTILLGLALLGCGCPSTTMINPRDCHDMCYPRQVERYTREGCFCSDGQPPKPVPSDVEKK